jgi:hypothetical protein
LQHKEFVLLQRRDDRSLRQFKGHRNRTAEAAVYRVCPFVDGHDLMWNAAGLAPGIPGCLQADIMFRVRPVDTDIGREGMLG